MIITLTGENSFLISEELTKLSAKYDNNLNLLKINGSDIQLEELKTELSSYSLFSNDKLIILFEPSKTKGFDEYIQSKEFNLPDSFKLIIVEPSLDKRKSYYKFLKAKTTFKQLDKLALAELYSWVITYTKDRGGSISNDDARYLTELVGDDQFMLASEINKLIIYSESVTRDSIDLLSVPSASSTIFELLDAAFNFNIKGALTIYAEQRLQKVEPEQILAMISWQLNTLALYLTSKSLSSSEILAKSGLSPYTLNKARNTARKLTIGRVKQFVNELAVLDMASKTINLDLDEGLKNFIVGLRA
ncbi:MAG: DNA polymerase III subunit delta [Candidatus Saccharimonadales bacterium]